MTKLTYISAHVVEPRQQSERARFSARTCYMENPQENCPFLKRRQCIHQDYFLGDKCVYGGIYFNKTVQKRSRSYYDQVSDLKEKVAQIETLATAYASKTLAIVGDYVYLPYTHINHLAADYKHPFVAGKTFIKKEDFTPDVIVRLLQFRPPALFGGEIIRYRMKELPLFIYHLAYMMPERFAAVEEIFPKVRGALKLIEKNMQLKDVPLACMPFGEGESLGYKIQDKDREILVEKWDKETNTLTLSVPYSKSWFRDIGSLYFQNETGYSITCEPNPYKTIVTVCDEDLKRVILLEYPQYTELTSPMDLQWKKIPPL